MCGVSPQSAPFTVVDLDASVFTAQVDEADVSRVADGMAANVTLDAFAGKEFSSKVASIGKAAQATATGGTIFPVDLEMLDTGVDLLLGMKGDASIEVSAVSEAVVIPVEALFNENGKNFVYLVAERQAQEAGDLGRRDHGDPGPGAEGCRARRRRRALRPHAVHRRNGRAREAVRRCTGTSAAMSADTDRRPDRREACRCVAPRHGRLGDRADGHVVLEAENVTKTYRLTEEVVVNALCGVDMQVCEGEMLAIMGPSGSGKSTLMHIVGLLDTPSSGRVTIEGEDVSTMEPNALATVRNKRIGFVFQSFNLLSRTTAQANVELPLIYAGVSGARALAPGARGAASASASATGWGTSPTSSRAGSSSAWRSRARWSPTRASCSPTSPPATSTPAAASRSCRSCRTSTRQGITVVIVTHDANVARHAQRVVHIKDGRVVQQELVECRIERCRGTRALPGTANGGGESVDVNAPTPSGRDGESPAVRGDWLGGRAAPAGAMNLTESIRIALRALNANKVRSVLTMLGVIIGVAAVILLVSIGTGVQSQVTGSIQELGSNLLFVFPGNFEGGQGGGGVGGANVTKQFTLDDARYIADRLGNQAIVVPLIQAERAAARPATAR